MKTEIHPNYVVATVTCSCGNKFLDPLDEAGVAHRAVQRLPSLLHRQAEAGGHRRARRALRAPLRAARQEVAGDRLDPLRAVKLAALVDGHWEKEVADRGETSSFPGGAACLASGPARGWVLIDDGSPRRLGAALAWAWSRGVPFGDLHVLVEGAAAAEIVARRAAEMADPPPVWVVSGRTLTPAQPAPAVMPSADDPGVLLHLQLLRAHGVQPVVEHGVLRGEVLGLEVARVIDGRLEVGVGRHDRYARAVLGGDADAGGALDEAVAAVTARRRPGAGSHPANTLARSRWLRSVLCAAPGLVGATALTAVAPPLPLPDLTDNGAVPSVGVALEGEHLIVVASTGVDPDLVPSAADSRRIYLPEARLVIVVPEGDDHPVTRALAGALARPAQVRTVPRSWEGLAPARPASGL